MKILRPLSQYLSDCLMQSFRYRSYFFIALFLSSHSLTIAEINDGPYVTIGKEGLEVISICKNKKLILKVPASEVPKQISHCGHSFHLQWPPIPAAKIEYSGDFKVAATSDFHGQYELTMKLLRNNQIIDEQDNWAFGNGHFVITGDIFDRGNKVTELLWFLYGLEHQALAEGGKLHLLLGNHETMVLNGDLRYLHPKYNKVSEISNHPFEQLFNGKTLIGKWLRSKPVLVKINNLLFAHGGFHPSLAEENRSLDEINQVFKSHLIASELNKPREGFGKYLHKTHGPIWYRGYFKKDGAKEAEVDRLLNHFNVNHIIVGHTSQEQIETRYDGKVIAIDSSIKNGKYGEILLIEGDHKWRGTLFGDKLKLLNKN